MFIGHFALGFAAKRVAPRVPLWVLFTAAQWADLLWPIFLAVGIERVRIDPGNTAVTPLDFVSYPWSHSLATLLVWGILVSLAYGATVRRDGTMAAILAPLVVSHWFLDYVTHRPDMPVYPYGPKLGLGLWNSVVGTVTIESLMFAAGVWIYVRATRPRDGIGRWSFVALSIVLVVAYAANLVSGPPPSVTAIWTGAIAGAVILLAWSAWVDAHREARSG